MSDNDLIKSGDLKKQVLEYVRTHSIPTVTGVLALIGDAPAVPQEMTAREYLETESRMCKYYGLPGAFDVSGLTVDEAISMVEKFAREHPEEMR